MHQPMATWAIWVAHTAIIFGDIIINCLLITVKTFTVLISLMCCPQVMTGCATYIRKFYLGSKREQWFRFAHYQRLNKNVAAGLQYSSIVSPSLYKRAFTDLKSFSGYLIFETTNHRYSAMANYVSNKVDNNMNGGLVTDTSLTDASGIDTKTLAVNLDNAQWLTRSRQGFLMQQFNFAFTTDTVVTKDTLIKSTINTKPLHYLHHRANYQTYGELFTSSNDSAFWPETFLDSTQTNDSASVKQLLNEMFLHVTAKKLIETEMGLQHQFMEVKQAQTDSTINRLAYTIRLQTHQLKNLNAQLSYTQNVAGNTGNYLIAGKGNYLFKNAHTNIQADI